MCSSGGDGTNDTDCNVCVSMIVVMFILNIYPMCTDNSRLTICRCQSIKLTECIRIQGDEIQKIDELRKQLRECKYKNIIATEERDSKIQELMELKKWTEALKTRFDVVEKEKQNSIEKTEVVSSNCVFLQETVRLVQVQGVHGLNTRVKTHKQIVTSLFTSR